MKIPSAVRNLLGQYQNKKLLSEVFFSKSSSFVLDIVKVGRVRPSTYSYVMEHIGELENPSLVKAFSLTCSEFYRLENLEGLKFVDEETLQFFEEISKARRRRIELYRGWQVGCINAIVKHRGRCWHFTHQKMSGKKMSVLEKNIPPTVQVAEAHDCDLDPEFRGNSPYLLAEKLEDLIVQLRHMTRQKDLLCSKIKSLMDGNGYRLMELVQFRADLRSGIRTDA